MVGVEVSGGSGAYTYRWQDENGNILGTENTQQVGKSGRYCVRIADVQQKCLREVCIDFCLPDELQPKDFLSITAPCGNQAPALLSAGGFASYLWSDGSVAQQISVNHPGWHSLTVTDRNGCRGADSLLVEAINLDFKVEKQDPACDGASDAQISIRNVTGGLPPYLYSLNDGPYQNEAVFSGLPAGQYRLRAQESQGCFAEKEVLLTDPPPFIISLGEDRTIDLGDTVQLWVQGNQAFFTVQWTPPEGLSCDRCPNPAASPRKPVRYTAVAVSDKGCAAEAGISIDVTLRNLAYAPNAFSPNQDGVNDYFTLYGPSDLVEIRSLRIVDRWGNLVFEREHLTPGAAEDSWDGTYRNQALPTGVYIYFAEVAGPDGRKEALSGEVVLLR